MKKFALTLCLFGMTLSGAAWSEPSSTTSRLYAQQCSNLKNTATALEMWAADNNGAYPDSLQELTPNYLKHVLPEIVYLKDPSKNGYGLRVLGHAFKELGVGEGFPRYDSGLGLQANANGAKPELNLPLLKPALDSSWNDRSGLTSYQWVQGHSSVSSTVFTEPFGNSENLKRSFESNDPNWVLDPVSGPKWRLLAGERIRTHPEGRVTLKFLELRCLEDGYMKRVTYETENDVVDQDVYVAFKKLMSQP
jgi:hypothetical protein